VGCAKRFAVKVDAGQVYLDLNELSEQLEVPAMSEAA
jgi:hypothetical protein